jgi:prepilin peptidase CpaA
MPDISKLALSAVVLTAALYDFRFRRIPNWLNVSGVITGIVVNVLLFAWHGIGLAAVGLLLSLAIYVPLYLLRAMGAGDVKLMAAIGCIVGPQNWVGILVCTALAGGVLALCVSIANGRLRQTLHNVVLLLHELMRFRPPAREHNMLDVKHERSMRLPHGIAIAAGSLGFLALPHI